MIAGATGCTRHKLSALTSSSSDMSSDNAGIPGGNQVVETHLGQNVKSTVKEVGKKSSLENNLLKRPLNLAANRRSVMQANGNMLISSKNHEGSSSSTGLQTSSAKEHFADTGPVRAHVYRSKEQPRVSLDLPKTGPTLKFVHNLRHQSLTNVQQLPSSNKTLSSSPIENKMRGRASTTGTPSVNNKNCGANKSDDEKKKKSVTWQRKKNGRKKEEGFEAQAVVDSVMQTTKVSVTRPEEEATNLNQAADKEEEEVEEELRNNCPTLLHQNSSKKLISCSMMSCEVVDIRELPHTSQSGTNDPLPILNKSSVS